MKLKPQGAKAVSPTGRKGKNAPARVNRLHKAVSVAVDGPVPPVTPGEATRLASTLVDQLADMGVPPAEMEQATIEAARKILVLDHALRHTTKAAADKFGVPERSIRFWLSDPTDPEAATVRERMQAGIQDRILTAADRALGLLLDKMANDQTKPKDLAVITGILYDKLLKTQLRNPVVPNTVSLRFGLVQPEADGEQEPGEPQGEVEAAAARGDAADSSD